MAETADGAQGLDSEAFREVIGHFMSGVTVITTSVDGTDHGMSASAVSSLSLDPPMLLVCLNDQSTTQKAVSQARTFCVNILAEGQHDLALHFARPSEDRFAGLAIERGVLGAPLLADALATLECEVTDDVRGGTHRVFLARVRHASARAGSPLAYFRGSFGRIELTADETAYAKVYDFIIHRGVGLDEPVEVADVAERLELRPSHVYPALIKLESEGLLVRDDDGVLFIRPIDQAMSDDAFDARCIIELGVAHQTIGKVGGEAVARLRRLMEAANAFIEDGRITDVTGYVAANAAFHEHMVGLAGSESLLAAYRRLTIPTIMTRLFRLHDEPAGGLAADHEDLVRAYETGVRELARVAITRHTERAKDTNNRAIADRGGRV